MTTEIFPRKTILALGALLVSLAITTQAHAQPETLTIGAANSLKDALRKILPLFEAQHPEINVRVIYGPSQTLRKQIEEGAPLDVYLPSLFEEIDQLEKKGLVIQGSKRVYAGTSLVLITGTNLPAPLTSIQELHTVPVRRIAIGDPKASSVGKVAAQFLQQSKLDSQLKSQFIYGEHSRAVLDLVAKGEAELGLVYRTDALSDEHVRILDTAPESTHTPIRYGVAIVWTARNISGAGDFIEFLQTPQIRTQFKDHGFEQASRTVGMTQQQEVQP